MIYSDEQDVTTAGTRVALASSRTIANWVTIQAKFANTGSIYVGNDEVDSSEGIELLAADSTTLPGMGVPAYDLRYIYIDSSVSGEGVKVLYGRN
jgi:hypothetical protein